jgi:hypothetical protein
MFICLCDKTFQVCPYASNSKQNSFSLLEQDIVRKNDKHRRNGNETKQNKNEMKEKNM